MNNFKLSILFVVQKVKTNKKGKCPLRCRLTYMKKRKEFSTGLFIKPENWDSRQHKHSWQRVLCLLQACGLQIQTSSIQCPFFKSNS